MQKTVKNWSGVQYRLKIGLLLIRFILSTLKLISLEYLNMEFEYMNILPPYNRIYVNISINVSAARRNSCLMKYDSMR